MNKRIGYEACWKPLENGGNCRRRKGHEDECLGPPAAESYNQAHANAYAFAAMRLFKRLQDPEFRREYEKAVAELRAEIEKEKTPGADHTGSPLNPSREEDGATDS